MRPGRSILEHVGAAAFERQPRRGHKAIKPCGEKVVRAHHLARAIGNRDRDIIVIDRLPQHRPVGQRGLANDCCGEQAPREQHPARRDREPGEEARRQDRIARRPEQQPRRQQRNPAKQRDVEPRQDSPGPTAAQRDPPLMKSPSAEGRLCTVNDRLFFSAHHQMRTRSLGAR